MLNYIRKPRRNEDGASAVEYGLLVAAIAALIVAIVFVLGGVVSGKFQCTSDAIQAGGGDCSTADTSTAG